MIFIVGILLIIHIWIVWDITLKLIDVMFQC